MRARSIGRVYFGSAVANHARVLAMLERLPRAERVECTRYGEVFNRKAQDFRL